MENEGTPGQMMVVGTARVYITNGDVMKNAKRCKLCGDEAGMHVVVHRDRNGAETRQQKLCPKAWNRFVRRNPELQFDQERKQYFFERLTPEKLDG
jgi:hypothetical protein